MAENVTHGAAKFKDAQGNTVVVQGLSNNDVTKVKGYFTKSDTNAQEIESLKATVKSINQGQRMLAYKDYFTNEDHKDEMAVGVFYVVPFNTQGQFLEFDPKTGKPKDPQAVEGVTDLKVAYTELVYKNSDETVNKLGRQDTQMSFADMATLSTDQTFTGTKTFSKDVVMTATQDATSLEDNKLATAKFVREVADQKIAAAGHLMGKYSASDPGDSIEANQIVFYPTPNLLD